MNEPEPEPEPPLSPWSAPVFPPAESENDLPPVILEPLASPRAWGPWATLGWTALALVVMVVIQNVVAGAFIVIPLALGLKVEIADLMTNGNLIATAALVSTPAVAALVFLLVRLRRCSLREYLALSWPRPWAILSSIAGLATLLFLSDAFSLLLGRPIVPAVMVTAYKSSWPPLLMLAVIFAAPLGEETIMRGFLFQGIAASRWGETAAIGISALIWSVIHIQYDLYGIGTVFVTGLYLGSVRQRTGSVPLCMVLHGIGNTVATVEVMLLAR